MLKLNHGELPTNKNSKDEVLRLDLFNHYLNHRYTDIPNSEFKSSKRVIDGIIYRFSKKYRPEKYFRNKDSFNSNITSSTNDDSIEDLRSVAHMAVWEATHKYIWGVNKKLQKEVIHVRYNDKFSFCQFASKQVEFKLQTFLRKSNLDRTCGYAPDSDNIRKVYTKLPKIKFDKGGLSENDFINLSSETNGLDKNNIKALNNLIISKTTSGDEEVEDAEGNTVNSWSILVSNKNISPDYYNKQSVVSLEDLESNNQLIKNFNYIRKNFLNSLPKREREILNNTKFQDFNNSNKKILTLSKLGKKFNISGERVRKISEKKFLEFINVLKKNKKLLGI